METVFEASHLTKAYNGKRVLRIRHLRIASGGVHGLVGPNGSGKSTLLEILAGVISPTTGKLLYRGRPVPEALRGARFLARDVTLVLQQPFLFRGSVRHNVRYGLRARGMCRREAGQRVERYLEQLGLLELADRDASDLSGGEMQRAALARALVLETPVLLLDEPLSHVDAACRGMITEVIAGLRAAGRTVLVAAHDANGLLALADSIIRLDDGACDVTEDD